MLIWYPLGISAPFGYRLIGLSVFFCELKMFHNVKDENLWEWSGLYIYFETLIVYFSCVCFMILWACMSWDCEKLRHLAENYVTTWMLHITTTYIWHKTKYICYTAMYIYLRLSTLTFYMTQGITTQYNIVACLYCVATQHLMLRHYLLGILCLDI